MSAVRWIPAIYSKFLDSPLMTEALSIRSTGRTKTQVGHLCCARIDAAREGSATLGGWDVE